MCRAPLVLGYNKPVIFTYWNDGLQPLFKESTLGSLPHLVSTPEGLYTLHEGSRGRAGGGWLAAAAAARSACRNPLAPRRRTCLPCVPRACMPLCAWPLGCAQVDLGTSEMHHAYEFWERLPGSRDVAREGGRGQKRQGHSRAA